MPPPGRSQAAFADLAKQKGWKLLRAGWPDYLVIADGKVRLVEVKGTDALLASQRELFAALETLGVNVEVWCLATERFVPWREFKQAGMPPYESRAQWDRPVRRRAQAFDPVLGC